MARKSKFIGFFLPAFLAVLTSVNLLSVTSAMAETHDINVRFANDEFHQVETRFEHSGKLLIVNNLEEQAVPQQLPFEVQATVRFGQRFTGRGTGDLQSIRQYNGTVADYVIDSGSRKSEINEERGLILARLKQDASDRIQLAGVQDYLTQRELELIRNPCDPLSFGDMFSRRQIEKGQSWKPESVALTDFLAVDRVYHNDITLTLTTVVDDIARIQIEGLVRAEVGDSKTEMQLEGNISVDLDDSMVRALRMSIVENRETGQIAAGFEGETRIDLRMSPTDEIDALTNEALSAVKSRQVDRKLKWQSEPGGFELVYDTRWKMIIAEQDAAILRYVDNGNLLAQCNIVQLPTRPSERPLSLQDFQSEVRKMVGHEKTASVVLAEAKRTRHSHTALRVVVESIEKQVPVQWIYYHLSAEDGRCVTFVFTLEQEVVANFDGADKLLVNQLAFGAIQQAQEEARTSERPATSNRRSSR